MHQLVVSCADNIAPVIQPEKERKRLCPSESALHLFFLYPYAISIWMLLQQRFQFELIKPGLTLRLISQNGFDKITTESQQPTGHYGGRVIQIWGKHC
jgi:hypothetical protein